MPTRYPRGFTLIELLIAIIVFGIGVIVVLHAVIHNLSMVARVRDNMTMTMLAKEGIELVYNMRDTNKRRGREWNCISITHVQCNKQYNHGQKIIIGKNSPSYKAEIISTFDTADITNNTSARIYKHTNGTYDHQNTGTPKQTGFYRYITFEKAILKPDGDAPADKLLKVTSTVVNTNRGTTKTPQNSVSIESFIGNY